MRQALELRIPPVAVWLLSAAGIWALDRWLPLPELVFPGRLWAALALFSAGVVVAVRGVIAFRRHSTTVHPSHPDRASTVVADDVFAVTRNPMYLGLALALAAWALLLGSLAGAAVFVPCFVIYLTELQIKPEERALTDKFGQAYLDYRDAVRRWL
ncbi:MAG: methyltransferase [Pseudomonadota bacterium]